MTPAARTILLLTACFGISFGGFFGFSRWTANAEDAPAAVAGKSGEPKQVTGAAEEAGREPGDAPTTHNEKVQEATLRSSEGGGEERTPTPIYQGQTLTAWFAQLDGDKDSRIEAAKAIARVGPDAHAAIPRLTTMLGDEDRFVRAAAALGLSGIGPKALPALSGAVKSTKLETCTAAIMALSWMGESGAPTLAKVLADTRKDLRFAATRLLGEMGEKAKGAIPTLVATLKDKDNEVALEATVALVRIGKASIPALTEALKEKNASFLIPVTLMQLGDEGAAVVARATQHPEPAVRAAAQTARGKKK